MSTRGKFWILVLLVWALVGFLAVAAIDDAHGKVTVGASGGHAIDDLSANVGHALPEHRYSELGKTPPAAAYVNVALRHQWADVAAGRHDTAIEQWAAQLTRTTRLVNVEHEGMTKTDQGTPAEYRSAVRRAVAIITTRAPWVRTVQSVTWLSIRHGVAAVDPWIVRTVDYLSSNVFNRATCSDRGWASFRSLALPLLALGDRYGKPVVVSEFASTASPKRAGWLGNATRFLDRHRGQFASVWLYGGTYYERCDFGLTTGAEYKAVSHMVATLGRKP